MHLATFVLVLPLLALAGLLAYVSSEPGFIHDGRPTGYSYALLFGLIAFAVLAVFVKYGRRQGVTSTGVVVAGTATAAVMTFVGVAAIVGGIISFIYFVFSGGWCNPRC